GLDGDDAPNGNDSNTLTLNVSAPPSSCMLHVVKTASVQQARPGDRVIYTIRVTNTGTQPYVAPNLATFSDVLDGVTDDAAYQSDADANSVDPNGPSGTVRYDQPTNTLSWSGPLAPGAGVIITYSVIVHDPADGNLDMPNTVVSTNPSNCPQGSTDP